MGLIPGIGTVKSGIGQFLSSLYHVQKAISQYIPVFHRYNITPFHVCESRYIHFRYAIKYYIVFLLCALHNSVNKGTQIQGHADTFIIMSVMIVVMTGCSYITIIQDEILVYLRDGKEVSFCVWTGSCSDSPSISRFPIAGGRYVSHGTD